MPYIVEQEGSVRDVLNGLFLISALLTVASILLSRWYPPGFNNPMLAGMVEIWTRWPLYGWVAGRGEGSSAGLRVPTKQ
jgi:hypothetical protein